MEFFTLAYWPMIIPSIAFMGNIFAITNQNFLIYSQQDYRKIFNWRYVFDLFKRSSVFFGICKTILNHWEMKLHFVYCKQFLSCIFVGSSKYDFSYALKGNLCCLFIFTTLANESKYQFLHTFYHPFLACTSSGESWRVKKIKPALNINFTSANL